MTFSEEWLIFSILQGLSREVQPEPVNNKTVYICQV